MYIKLIGIEAYGLIGVYMSVLGLLAVLDMGLSSTLSRELARQSFAETSQHESRNLVRTLELVYWGVGIAIGVLMVLIAPFIARNWIQQPQGFSIDDLTSVLRIMGLVITVQWPASLYSGGLMGLQRQVLLNWIRMIIVTLQHGGGVLLLLMVPSISMYFIWQIVMNALQTLLLAGFLWNSLPSQDQRAGFRFELLRKHWHFAANMAIMSILISILTQLDKVLLSKILTLQMFGYYMLAFNIAGSLYYIISPLYNAFYPRFCQLAVSKDYYDSLASLYHKGCQLMCAAVLPVAMILTCYSKQVLTLWVRDPVVVENTYVLLSMIVVGTSLNAILTMPYALQLAYGYTKIVLIQNVVCVIVLVPLLIVLTRSYGAKGAPVVWLLLNTGVFLFSISAMHRRYLQHEMKKWYVFDVIIPFLAVGLVGVISVLVMPSTASLVFVAAWMSGVFLLSSLLCLLVMPAGRGWIRLYLLRKSV
jgi:O-antigen/teichoic acid export membrane protein